MSARPPAGTAAAGGQDRPSRMCSQEPAAFALASTRSLSGPCSRRHATSSCPCSRRHAASSCPCSHQRTPAAFVLAPTRSCCVRARVDTQPRRACDRADTQPAVPVPVLVMPVSADTQPRRTRARANAPQLRRARAGTNAQLWRVMPALTHCPVRCNTVLAATYSSVVLDMCATFVLYMTRPLRPEYVCLYREPGEVCMHAAGRECPRPCRVANAPHAAAARARRNHSEEI